MSGIARKIERNKLKAQIKKDGMKRNQPLSKYRFKTQKHCRKIRTLSGNKSNRFNLT